MARWLLPALTVLLILWAMTGFVRAGEGPCYPRDVLAGYLRDKGMPLHAWGLTSDGNMHELFLSPSGDWAVIETRPDACSRVVSTLDKAGGRLWVPPQDNRVAPSHRFEGGWPS